MYVRLQYFMSRTDGILSGSRIGFKGVEDLDGGLKANFVLEAGINPDTGTEPDRHGHL